MTEVLTLRVIDQMLPSGVRQERPDGHTKGLYITLHPSGSKCWTFRFRFQEKQEKITIGSYPEIGIKDARDIAKGYIVSIAKGTNPAEDRRRQKATCNLADNPNIVRHRCEEFIQRYAKTEEIRRGRRQIASFQENSWATIQKKTSRTFAAGTFTPYLTESWIVARQSWQITYWPPFESSSIGASNETISLRHLVTT